MRGLMQEHPLTIDWLLRRATTVGAAFEVVSVEPAGVDRRTWAEIGDRALRLAAVLQELGVSPGAAVGSFAWNGHRHLELYYGVPASGRVLHAVNVRLHGDDVAYVVRHAADEILFVDAALTPVLAPIRDRLGVKQIVVMDDGSEVHPDLSAEPRYEDLLDACPPAEPAPGDEGAAASICFTSGTTGRPKAVVYSHRSVVLHALGELTVDGHGVRRGDVILPLTPMFHVNCWGLPYAAGLAPASLVFAGADTSPEAVARLIAAERPTVVAGIPTFWVQMNEVFERGDHDLSSVERILCGGAEAPPALIRRYTDRGIDFFHGWGMTEMSPSGSGSWVRGSAGDVEAGAKQGVASPLVELRIVDGDGAELPWDGTTVGELQARGPWVASAYLDAGQRSDQGEFDRGWLRTGDVARIAADGTMEIVDRAKDLVKSGGEWISSVELERVLAEHPAVAESAIVALPHPHWGERPGALVVLRTDADVDADDLRRFLATRVASWWVPEVIEFVADLPKTGVGKIDKKRLRAEMADAMASREEPRREQ